MELSRSPQFNEVIKQCRGVLEGTALPEDLKKSIKEMNNLRRQMQNFFTFSRDYQEKDSPYFKEAAGVDGGFASLKKGLVDMYEYFNDGKTEHLTRGLEEASAALEQLFAAFDRLKAAEEKAPVYSPSPAMNELMRVGYGVVKGSISPQAFRARLEGMMQFHQEFARSVEQAKPLKAERELYEERKAAMREAFQEVWLGLNECSLFFSDGNMSHIDGGLKRAGAATEKLLAIERELKAAVEAPKMKLCFRCGAPNEMTFRFCTKCKAQFPPLTPAESPSVDVRLEEGGVAAAGHAMTESTAKLMEIVEKIQKKTAGPAALKQVIEEMRRKADTARRDLDRLERPRDVKDAEVIELMSTTEETLRRGIAEFSEGIEQMAFYLADENPSALTSGLERALLGADKIFQVQMFTQSMKEAQKT
jgi:hypothetical protein